MQRDCIAAAAESHILGLDDRQSKTPPIKNSGNADGEWDTKYTRLKFLRQRWWQKRWHRCGWVRQLPSSISLSSEVWRSTIAFFHCFGNTYASYATACRPCASRRPLITRERRFTCLLSRRYVVTNCDGINSSEYRTTHSTYTCEKITICKL